ncbi:hypothetical protein [Psychroflexus planctonicus]|uniref:Uncharacterized protein n=1 Tax=Psychroflexus planctonicus TaxID=1526575 RepID=A0ABQ1SGK8_9FLAO|nr:hypothetical protein [Psychroflexus planctonicus]GGE31513.1 hypothetical protein GCM10010832_09860 [Psychroflexus planctonicus]
MEIYNINSNFDLFRFKDFDNHNLSSPEDIQRHLLNFVSFNINLVNSKGHILKSDPNQRKFENLFNEISDRKPYDFFNMLISIYPSVIFSDDMFKIDKWKILKNTFKSLENEDNRLLKSAINFRLNISEIEIELNKIKDFDYAEIDKSIVYQNLFKSLYKYLFVLFSESIEFPVPQNHQSDLGTSFSFDFKSLKNEVEKRLHTLNSNDFSKKKSSKDYLNNVCESAKLTQIENLNYFLVLIQPYAKHTTARKEIYNSFLKPLKVDNEKTKYRASSILKNITRIVIVPLFQPVFGNYQDEENFVRLCDNLSRN